MKIATQTHEPVIRNNIVGEKKFQLVYSAKMAQMLSDGLYSDKISSIIREISCNAYDAHVMAGVSDQPFQVHMPTLDHPYFSVQDWGPGLDPDQIDSVFTVYGVSTKIDNNDAIGQLGLGCKSPFAYTSCFTVTSVKNGIKTVYSMFKDETGMPSCAAMGPGVPTSDPNGVLIEIPVANRDFAEFYNKAKMVYTWFEVKPQITGHQIDIPNMKESVVNIGDDLFNISGDDWWIPINLKTYTPIARMGVCNCLFCIGLKRIIGWIL